jgi:hypothetical protein
VKRPAPAAFFLLLALTSACATSGGSEGQTVGRVEGTVFLGPQCAVEGVTSPCPDVPVADVTVELVADGEVVAADVSDDAGGFVLEAEPGSYVLRPILPPEPLDQTRFAKPVSVTVVAGSTVHADVLIDTGIR